MRLLLASLALLATAPAQRWTPPYKDLGVPANPQPYIEMMKDQQEKIVLEGDKLTFLFKSKQDKVELMTGLTLEMKHIANSDVWIAQAQMADWDKAFFNYSFADGGYKMGAQVNFQLWTGPNAPKAPTPIDKLSGTLSEEKLKSKALGEERSITVYLPPNAGKDLPAVYLADGQSVPGYARTLEPLILAKKVRPVALIGVHCGEYKGDRSKAYEPTQDMRMREYLKQADPETYAKHLKFFSEEVVEWATKKYRLSNKQADRALQGVSNGGAFATTAPVDHPGVFAYTMPFSVAAYDHDKYKTDIKGKKLPKFYFAAGTLETFIRGTNAAQEMLRAESVPVMYETYTSGHDMVMWNIAFLRYVQLIFPAR